MFWGSSRHLWLFYGNFFHKKTVLIHSTNICVSIKFLMLERYQQKNRQKSLPSMAYITVVKFKISFLVFQSYIYLEFGMKWLLFSSVDFGLQPCDIKTLLMHRYKLSGKQFCNEYQKLRKKKKALKIHMQKKKKPTCKYTQQFYFLELTEIIKIVHKD